MGEIRHEGYRFDTGPSLFTLPEMVEEIYEAAGRDFKKEFPYRRLETVCRYFYEDGMVVNAWGDPERFINELKEKAGEDDLKIMKYLHSSRRVYDLTFPFFIERSLHRWDNYLRWAFIPALLRLYRIKPLTRLHQLHEKTFRHPNVIQLFDRFATYNGSSPYKTPATMMVIPHLEHNLGAYFPEGGMYQIAYSLEQLGREMGVRYHYNTEVEEIALDNHKSTGNGKRRSVSGVRFREAGSPGPDFLPCSRVVTDLDIYFVYKHLLPGVSFPGKWFRHERSTSALIFYWGLETTSPGLDVHNILFSADYPHEFECLFEKKIISDDPTVYLFISSKIVKSDAPQGCENWFVMINTPENVGQDWDSMIAEARTRIQEKIRRMTGVDVQKHLKFEFIRDPRSIERDTASYRGSLYGNSSNSMFAAFQRHPNFSQIKGLYLTGGSVHPGGGIPLCLSSARIVSGLISSNKL